MKKAAAMGEQRATLLREPPPDPSKSPMENTLEVTELVVLGPVSISYRTGHRARSLSLRNSAPLLMHATIYRISTPTHAPPGIRRESAAYTVAA